MPRVVKLRDDVWAVLKSKILRPCVTCKGYNSVILSKNGKTKPFSVHVLIAMAWLQYTSCNGYVVNHLNGNKIDNCLYNLEITTVKGNAQHAIRTGLVKTGFDSQRSLLSYQQGIAIWQEKHSTNCTNKYLADKYKVSRTTILRVLRRLNYEQTLNNKC